MTAEIIQGSWFPSGYHGHFRSKSRPDFVNEYRQLARPQPPQKFYKRSQEPTRKHVFSHHDNRQAFLNDALIFQQGLGRRRVQNSTYAFKNDFIAWMPEREYVERSRPLASTYKLDFNEAQGKCQLYTHRPKTSFDGVNTTSYRYAHGLAAPNREVIDAMNNQALKLSLLNRKNRAMTAVNRGRESVATCLTWHASEEKAPSATNQEGPTRPVVPPATQTSTFMPHPPTAPKSQSSLTVPHATVQAWPAPEGLPVPQQSMCEPVTCQPPAPEPVSQPASQPMAE